ncbi:MAG: hypothetical protein R6X21_09415, partial [Candidatus Aminicenantes bacterium]
MSEQLQGLIQRIQDEGVAKAREEAAKILEEAQAKAGETLKKAEAEAKSIVEAAREKAEELDRNTRSDTGALFTHHVSKPRLIAL